MLNTETDEAIPESGASNIPDMESMTVNKKGVKKLLQNLGMYKAPGADEIPSRFLKEYADTTAPILTKIFQRSFNLELSGSNGKRPKLHQSLRNEIEMTLAIAYLPHSLA